MALLALQALSAPSVGFVGPPQNDTTMPAQCSFPGGDGPRGWGGGAIKMAFEGKKRPPPADREKKELWSLVLSQVMIFFGRRRRLALGLRGKRTADVVRWKVAA